MITTIPPRAELNPVRRPAGFTLVELIVAASISAVVVVAVLTTVLFLARSAMNIRNYSDMETEARNSLELFAEDTRQASKVSWNINATSVTLMVNAIPITYTYSSANGTFTRTYGAGGTPRQLLSGISSFTFNAYTITTVAITDFSTATAVTSANKNTKQIQISLSAKRSRSTLAGTTNIVLSARYILRNKVVTA